LSGDDSRTPLFSRMAVLGLGLLGGSVAVAARERGVVGQVVGYARRRPPLDWALANGLVDAVVDREGGAAEAVRDADLVVLATPVSSMAAVLEEAAPGLADGVVVTDVGSVKGPLADTLPGLLPAGASFVGSHPMAGSHETGVEYARPDLLEGACCVVTSQPGTDPAVADRLAAFWQALGARIARRDPASHDAEVAWVSHLPHMIAFAYARALAAAPDSAAEVAGSGFRDFVRIARSDSELWGDILGLNHKALAGPLRSFSEALAELARAIEENDPTAAAERERILESAADRLNSLAPSGVTSHTGAHPEPDSARSGGENPEIQAAPRAAATRSVNRNS
jgi:prephenate dehydrogenase